MLSNEIESVVVPEMINGKPVTVIGDDCFFDCYNLKEIIIPSTVTIIGGSAFALCKGLKEIVLPDSITDIGMYAFRDCTSLKRIVLPEKLKCLRRGVFAFCYFSDDVEIVLKEGLESIESNVFYCGGLTRQITLNIPDSVKYIAPGAFEHGMTVNTILPYDEEWFS